MYGISALARRFGLSRSALLHYDRIGLLRPDGRSAAGYRRYSEEDALRLETICRYRNADVPLTTIAALMTNRNSSAVRAALEAHLEELDRRMRILRAQQARVMTLLGAPAFPDGIPVVSVAELKRMLRAAGLDDDGFVKLHVLFEYIAPSAHQTFLEALGLTAVEIDALRTTARRTGDGGIDTSESALDGPV
jgi:MerR family transcriptional regulator, thiopeptide resistance regulator